MFVFMMAPLVLQTYMDYFYPIIFTHFSWPKNDHFIDFKCGLGWVGHMNIFKLNLLTFAPEKTKGLNLCLSVIPTHKMQGKKTQTRKFSLSHTYVKSLAVRCKDDNHNIKP